MTLKKYEQVFYPSHLTGRRPLFGATFCPYWGNFLPFGATFCPYLDNLLPLLGQPFAHRQQRSICDFF